MVNALQSDYFIKNRISPLDDATYLLQQWHKTYWHDWAQQLNQNRTISVQLMGNPKFRLIIFFFFKYAVVAFLEAREWESNISQIISSFLSFHNEWEIHTLHHQFPHVHSFKLIHLKTRVRFVALTHLHMASDKYNTVCINYDSFLIYIN